MFGMSRRILQSLCLLALLPLALVATGCSENNPFEPENPNAPTPTQVTDTFSGTVNRNGAITFPFVANTGSIAANLETVTPSDATIGMALGEWNATTELCQLRLTNDAATQGDTLLGAAQVTQNYCLRVYDATGQLSGPVAFTINVQHF
jgi:hypothetical protein